MLSQEMEKHFLYAEGVDGRRLGEDEIITKDNSVMKFTTAATTTNNVTSKETEKKQETKPKPPKKTKEEDN